MIRWFARGVRAAIGVREVLLLGGLGAVFYGAHAIYPPAAWLAVGSVVLALAVFGLPAIRTAR